MRESFGGTFMIQLMLIFIIIFVSFLAVALNYSKAFRVKNGVINILEQYQYDGTANDLAIEKVNDYVESLSYSKGKNTKLQSECSAAGEAEGVTATFANGVCIIPMDRDNLGKYYKVVTYIPIELNFFDLNFYISVSGETKIIE